MRHEEVVERLRVLLTERLRVPPERTQTLELDTPLLQDGLGLDSLDCVELTMGIEEAFGIAFDEGEDDWMHHFSSLQTLSQLVLQTKGEAA